MSPAATSNHITLDVIADYFAELLADEHEEQVELHIADCDRCAASARWVHSLPRPNLEGWTAQAHGAAALRACLATSLAQAAEASPEPSWRERLLRWRERLPSETRGALHLIKETRGTLTRGLDVLMPPPGWELAARTVGVSAATSFKANGTQTEGEAAPEAPTVRVLRRGIGIEVRVEHPEEGEPPRLVALIPTREGGRPTVQVLKPARDEPRTLTARFEKEDEDFVIALEPASAGAVE